MTSATLSLGIDLILSKILGYFFDPVDRVHVRFVVLGGDLKYSYLLDIHTCIRTDSMCCRVIGPRCFNYYIFTVLKGITYSSIIQLSSTVSLLSLVFV